MWPRVPSGRKLLITGVREREPEERRKPRFLRVGHQDEVLGVHRVCTLSRGGEGILRMLDLA